MFEFKKTMAGVKEQVAESQNCGCGSKKSQESVGANNGNAKISHSGVNQEEKQTVKSKPSSIPVNNCCNCSPSSNSQK